MRRYSYIKVIKKVLYLNKRNLMISLSGFFPNYDKNDPGSNPIDE